MVDQKLVDELEKALTDEAYDGGMGALSGEEFSELVRTLAVTAAEVVEKAHTPTDDEREALWDAFDDMHRITEGGCDTRGDHVADMVLGLGFRRTEVPEPSRVAEMIEQSSFGTPEAQELRATVSDEKARALVDEANRRSEPQGEPSDAATVHLMARKGGKTQALIDAMLAQANERGIRVEVVDQTIPMHAMLDIWMALYGHDNSQAFDGFYESAGYAEAWATLLAAIRARAGESQGEPSDAQLDQDMVDAVGGVIHSGYQEDRDPYAVARDVLQVVGTVARRSCTPSAEAYRAGGDSLVYAVADWISAGGVR